MEFMWKNNRFCGNLGEEFGDVEIWELSLLTSLFDLICTSFDSMGKAWFPIGSDDGDEIICIKLTSSAKELFYIPRISISDKDAIPYCSAFSKVYDAIKLHFKV